LLKKGFTLIELLIVITIIGILAVAILSAINPIEQINRAQDSRTESDSAELLNALERYFTATFNYPWSTGPNETAVGTGAQQQSWMQALVDNGEVKQEFLRRSTWSKVYVTQGAAQLVYVCFIPSSIDYGNQASGSNTKRDGQLGCSGTSGSTGCHICLPR